MEITDSPAATLLSLHSKTHAALLNPVIKIEFKKIDKFQAFYQS